MKLYEILGPINILEGFFLKKRSNYFSDIKVKARYSLDEATINTTVGTIRSLLGGDDYSAISAVSDEILDTARAKYVKTIKGPIGNWVITLFAPSPKYGSRPFVQVIPPKESRDTRPTYYAPKEK